MDHVEVNVVTLPMERWILEYYRPEQFADACRMCPNFGKVWSCPILPNPVLHMLKPFSRVHLIGVKVVYKKETIAAADTAAKADAVRVNTYDKVKRILLESMLELEKEIPGSWSLAAGECKICKKCARQDGLPCRHPDRMRFSFSGFGFDLVRIAHDLFGYELLWNPNGLPEYTVAFGCLLDRENRTVSQQFTVQDARPWELLQEQVLGVLSQLGCEPLEKSRSCCQNIRFDTPEKSLAADVVLQQRDNSVRLVWNRREESEPEGLHFSREDSLELSDLSHGAVADFVREHLGSGNLLLPREEETDRQESVDLADRSAGDRYRLIFHHRILRAMPGEASRCEHSLELVSVTGSGRRIRQIAGCLRSRFPELTPEG